VEATPPPVPIGSVAAVTDDIPPPPQAKPAEGAAELPAEKPKKAKSQSKTKSAKRVFKREVNRLRRFFSD